MLSDLDKLEAFKPNQEKKPHLSHITHSRAPAISIRQQVTKNLNRRTDHDSTPRGKDISSPCTRCTGMSGRKIKFGVSLDQRIVERIDDLVQGSSDLRATRSEMVEAILTAYFRSQIKHSEKARELIITRRKGLL